MSPVKAPPVKSRSETSGYERTTSNDNLGATALKPELASPQEIGKSLQNINALLGTRALFVQKPFHVGSHRRMRYIT